ncbi:hypothetical protein VTN96DRAFT_2558 [Rasamsonia emersonii]|uniref:Deoxyribose-phosphate aldolase n=1 Tax=Rasamsonia emersonii (strain ATCC 16479 / CBS 393.64 / IMI 116815) TaxID=1408163 RepID=A0A0F4YG61_RASE3|nr:hypothetical protein T310_9277 [Rasamsonia emersonii CBS 393.64]KKA17100.1 hypothetical protein T310_9277 [Rasamsonia emersonii CBS 393.64]
MAHKSKKRKISQHQTGRNDEHVDTSKPSAIFTPKGPRLHTLSVALPGSIIENAKSHDQKTFLAGTIARALAVFSVDEVVIFDDDNPPRPGRIFDDLTTDEYTATKDPSHFLAHLLSYLETPPHLRKHLFPMHPNLRTAGTLPSLDMPHHPRADEWCDYREGVVVSGDGEKPTLVDTGLPKKIQLNDYDIPSKTRVTIKFGSRDSYEKDAEPVDPAEPREQAGYYWGYSVRRCGSLSAVFTECPFDGGYDLSFGTSERGAPISQVLAEPSSIPKYRHLLVVFGGVAGIEAAITADPGLLEKGLTPATAGELFDYWVNVLPDQGSRTIRTEEAVWLGLMGLRGLVERNG